MKRFLISLSIVGLMLTSNAQSHVMLESSSPQNNAVMIVAPKTLDLNFGHPTKLVMLKILRGDVSVPIHVDLSAEEAKVFSVSLPPLSPGQYQVIWSTLSADGHPMKGNISFTISGK